MILFFIYDVPVRSLVRWSVGPLAGRMCSILCLRNAWPRAWKKKGKTRAPTKGCRAEKGNLCVCRGATSPSAWNSARPGHRRSTPFPKIWVNRTVKAGRRIVGPGLCTGRLSNDARFLR